MPNIITEGESVFVDSTITSNWIDEECGVHVQSAQLGDDMHEIIGGPAGITGKKTRG